MATQQYDYSANLLSAWRRRRQTALVFWGFVGPLMLGLLVFVYYPIVWGFVLSFCKARDTITPQAFVGLANYVTMLKNPEFRKSLLTFVIFAACIVPTTLFCALGLALLVNSVRAGRGLFRSVFFIPTACSYVAASMVWRTSLFSGIPSGFANNVMYWLGYDTQLWIGTLHLQWIVLVTARLWLQLGFYMILFLAGMQEIPRMLYEAARVDGSGRWSDFRYITWPLLRNTTVSVLLLNLIAAFQAFAEFFNILTSSTGAGSGNLRATCPPLAFLYLVAFVDRNYALGAAGAFILTALIIVFTILQGRIIGFGKEHY